MKRSWFASGWIRNMASNKKLNFKHADFWDKQEIIFFSTLKRMLRLKENNFKDPYTWKIERCANQWVPMKKKKKGRRKYWWWIPECAYKKGVWKRRVSEGKRQEYNITTAQKPKKRLLDTGFSYFTASNISYAAERIRNVIKRTPLYCLISESSQRFVSAKS